MSGHKDTILLVDDDPAILLTVGDRLESEGYAVIRAASSEQALERLNDARPDLIILDISMPGEGGMAFLRKVTTPQGSLMYPVLIFTARAELDKFFQQVEVTGFLPKTSDPETLTREVRRIISARRASAGGGADSEAGWKVLLAEDDPEVRENMVKVIGMAGYAVTAVADGYAVIERAVMEPPAVIVIKQLLPRMKGTAAAAILSTLPSVKGVPVIVYDESGMRDAASRPINLAAFVPSNLPVRLVKTIDAIRRGETPAPV